nr:GNAT family N-acetyltransferase [Chromobacterium sp. ASV5]
MSQPRIRHAEPGDAAALREIMAEAGAYANTLQLPCPSLRHWESNMARLLAEGRWQLVCEDEAGRLIGRGGLWRLGEAQLGHAAGLGITVRAGCRSRGVGSALMAALMELADDWLGLRRIELTVFCDNAAAIALYRKFGFAEEARLRAYALRDGAYHDVCLMARLAA